MPSNDQLRTEANALADELGIAITTEGLNNGKLAALVSDLKAKKTDAETVTQADEVAEPVVASRKGVFIAEGKSLTTKRGILGPGEEITPEDLAGGKEAIAGFVRSKHLTRVV